VNAKTFAIEVTKTVKTEGDVRVRPVLTFVRELLEYAEAHGGGEGDMLLQPWVASNLNDTLRRVCEAVGAPRLSANDFRRGLASWLIQAGVAPNLVAFMLGHTSTAMVERVYGKMTADAAGILIEADARSPYRFRTPPASQGRTRADRCARLVLAESSQDPASQPVDANAGGVLIPLTQVRVLASEPLEIVIDGEPVPSAYDDADQAADPLSGFVAGLIARRRALPALLAGDRPGLARALSAIAKAHGEEIDAAHVLAAMVGGAS
jgi:hypothetical protein